MFSHRDYHRENLFIQDGPKIRIMDFQDALMAPAAQDLAVLLTTRDTDEFITPAIERRILDFYCAGLARRGAATDARRAEFMTSYRLCVLQHALKMIGRFEMFDRDGKTGYRRYIPNVLAQARRMLAEMRADFPRLVRGADAMKALVLAAGKGERLRPLTEVTPKPMLELGGRPLIHYPLAMLRRAGITEVAINIHHLGSAIQRGLGDGSALGMRITYAPEPVLLGTGGPLNGLRDFLGADETFVIANSDTILDLDLPAMLAFHRDRAALATIALFSPRISTTTAASKSTPPIGSAGCAC